MGVGGREHALAPYFVDSRSLDLYGVVNSFFPCNPFLK